MIIKRCFSNKDLFCQQNLGLTVQLGGLNGSSFSLLKRPFLACSEVCRYEYRPAAVLECKSIGCGCVPCRKRGSIFVLIASLTD